MHKSVFLVFLLPASSSLLAVPVEPARDIAQDERAIRQVVEDFRTSIIRKDKAKYMSLFFSQKAEDIGWQFVSEDVRLTQIRNKEAGRNQSTANSIEQLHFAN